MKQTYKLINYEDITNELNLPAHYEVNTINDTTYVLLYNGVIADIDKLNDDNISSILVSNHIRYTIIRMCEDCGEWEEELYRVNTRNGEIYVCDDCLYNSDNYFYCDHCDEWYDNNEVNHWYTHNDTTICEYCFNDYYDCCADCEEIYHRDDLIYNDDDCCYYCEYCYDDHSSQRLLYGYHEFNDWEPHKLDDETPEFYIGHELEIDYGDDMADAVHSIKNMANGICMHDGSLSSQGIEFISHPLSYNYMVSQEDNYRKLFDHLIDLGYKSHNTSDCGLHFHVTKPEDTRIIDRIILFMETYKEEIISLSRRKSEELNRWSRFLSDKRTAVNSKVIKSLDYIINNKDTCDRYMALNLTNNRTIEFRFFKGTLKYETFMADFEFVNNLVHFASDLTIPVEELTWTKVTSVGNYLPAYIEEHNLYSDTPIIDYSQELLVTFNEEKAQLRIEIDNVIGELLKNISNKARTKNNNSQKLRATINTIYNWNENLSSLQYALYELENLQAPNYNGLVDVKNVIETIKNRIGGNR